MACRSNLKQLDEITFGLRRRLLAGSEQVLDSESTVPLSTLSALMTVGSMLPSGTSELRSTLYSSDHVAPHVLVSTGDSTTTGDAVTELMRRTLECTDSHNIDTDTTYVKDRLHLVPDETNHTSHDDDNTDNRNSSTDCSNALSRDNQAEEQNSETQAATSVDHYTDSLKTAQMLLEQLNEITAANNQLITAASNRQVDFPIAVGFDEDGMQEDDTHDNIWALRQSIRCDDGDDDDESLDSEVVPDEHDKSYISPQALNDVGLSHDNFYAVGDLGGRGDVGELAELESDGKQQPAVGCSGESGDTWFIDTQDVRHIGNMASPGVCQGVEDVDGEPSGDDETVKIIADPVVEVHSAGRPLSQSSPCKVSPVGSPAANTARKSRSLRRTAVQRREQMCREQYAGSSSDSECDGFVTSMRLRHRCRQNSQHVPCDQPSVSSVDSRAPGYSEVVADEANNVVMHSQETRTVTNQDSENNTEDEPQCDSSDIVTARPANHGSPVRISSPIQTDGVTISSDHVVNGHHSASKDLYPCLYLPNDS